MLNFMEIHLMALTDWSALSSTLLVWFKVQNMADKIKKDKDS